MNPRAILAIGLRNIKRTLRDPMDLFWTIVFPIFFIALTAYVFIPPGPGIYTLKTAIINYDGSPAGFNFTATNFVNVLKNITIEGRKIFDIKDYDLNLDKALNDLKRGKLHLVIVIPEGFTHNITYSRAYIEVYVSGSDIRLEQVALAEVRGVISEISKRTGQIRIEIIKSILSQYYNSQGIMDWFNYIAYSIEPLQARYNITRPKTMLTRAGILGWYVIGMIGVEILFIGLFTGALALLHEKEQGTLRKLLSTPITAVDLLFGTVIDLLFSIMLSTIACILFGVYVVGAKIHWVWDLEHLFIIPLLILASLLTLSVGIFVSMACKNYRAASGIVTIIAWPTMFLTGIWFPKFMMPEPLRILADISPLTIIIDAMRNIMVFEASLSEVIGTLPIPIVITIVLFTIASIVFRRSLEKMIT